MGLLSRLKAAASALWSGPVAEATSEEIFGTPVPIAEFFTANGRFLSPVGQVYGPEQRSDRNVTLRTLQDHDRARNLSRVLAETNPNAIGLLQRLVAYNVGKGSSTEVHAAAEDEEPPKRLARKTRDFIDKFKKQGSHQNQWPRLEREMVWRLHVDGEFFLRFYPQKEGVTLVRFVEPQYVRPPYGEDAEGDWSYGVHTPDGDAITPEAYCVHNFRTSTQEIVEAQFVIHAKVNCLSNQKRGVPSLYAVEGELVGAAKLRHATREGEKNRASINYFRRHKAAGQGMIEGARAERSRVIALMNGIDLPSNASDVYVEVIEPGSTIDIPEGLDPLPPPGSPNTQGSSESVKQALEAVAARFGVPFWIASGDSGATNFAASLTAESPFAVTITDSQADLAELSDAAQTKALEIGSEQGLLPEDVLEQIDLLVSFPSPVSRNKLEETNRRKTLHDANVLSETTWMTEEGLDPEKERQQMIEERRDPIPPQPTRVPALPVDASTGQTVLPGRQPPSTTPAARYKQLTEQQEGAFQERLHAMSEQERADFFTLYESFSGRKKDSIGRERCYEGGKQVPCHPEAGGTPAGARGTDPAANRPTRPEERHAGVSLPRKEWRDPPPPRGKKGEGVTRGTGEQSQTKMGDRAEEITAALGLRNILPEGKRNFTPKERAEMGSSIDREYDHSGKLCEIKMCKTTATEYRLKAKAKEKEDKLRYAKHVEGEIMTVVPVWDVDSGEIHVYWHEGLTGSDVRTGEAGGWSYMGTVKAG